MISTNPKLVAHAVVQNIAVTQVLDHKTIEIQSTRKGVEKRESMTSPTGATSAERPATRLPTC